MRKRRIRLTEGDLRRIVNRSVKRVLSENYDNKLEYEYTEALHHLYSIVTQMNTLDLAPRRETAEEFRSLLDELYNDGMMQLESFDDGSTSQLGAEGEYTNLY